MGWGASTVSAMQTWSPVPPHSSGEGTSGGDTGDLSDTEHLAPGAQHPEHLAESCPTL